MCVYSSRRVLIDVPTCVCTCSCVGVCKCVFRFVCTSVCVYHTVRVIMYGNIRVHKHGLYICVHKHDLIFSYAPAYLEVTSII